MKLSGPGAFHFVIFLYYLFNVHAVGSDFIKLRYNLHNRISTILRFTLHCFQHLHQSLYPSPRSKSRTLPSLQKETPYLSAVTSPSSYHLATANLLSVSMNFLTLDISCTWDPNIPFLASSFFNLVCFLDSSMLQCAIILIHFRDCIVFHCVAISWPVLKYFPLWINIHTGYLKATWSSPEQKKKTRLSRYASFPSA